MPKRGRPKKDEGALRPQLMSRIRIDAATGCWEWTGSLDKDGYAEVWYDGKKRRGHRLAFKLWVGDVADDVKVMHTCDNPPCINPAHLKAGSQKENNRDARDKGRRGRLTREQAIAAKVALVGNAAADVAASLGIPVSAVASLKLSRIYKDVSAPLESVLAAVPRRL